MLGAFRYFSTTKNVSIIQLLQLGNELLSKYSNFLDLHLPRGSVCQSISFPKGPPELKLMGEIAKQFVPHLITVFEITSQDNSHHSRSILQRAIESSNLLHT